VDASYPIRDSDEVEMTRRKLMILLSSNKRDGRVKLAKKAMKQASCECPAILCLLLPHTAPPLAHCIARCCTIPVDCTRTHHCSAR
jgi:hypothetical protein